MESNVQIYISQDVFVPLAAEVLENQLGYIGSFGVIRMPDHMYGQNCTGQVSHINPHKIL